MSFEAINNSMGPNKYILTLLVSGPYPRMTQPDTPFPSITQRAIAMQKAMNEMPECTASQQIYNVFNTSNGLSTKLVHDLLINSPILVDWKGNAGQSKE